MTVSECGARWGLCIFCLLNLKVVLRAPRRLETDTCQGDSRIWEFRANIQSDRRQHHLAHSIVLCIIKTGSRERIVGQTS